MAKLSFDELLNASIAKSVSKRDLFDLIQYSKVPGSEYWVGHDSVINNTPQQGINWVGELPALLGVIIKVRPGSYIHDGWEGAEKNLYKYSFKARKGVISLREKANLALLNQAEFGYPILLFSELKKSWVFEGIFEVVECAAEYVTLGRRTQPVVESSKTGQGFMEGGSKYVTHLLSERNPQVVKALKASKSFVCEICNEDFKSKYGIEYIEAHHKIPVSNVVVKSEVMLDSLALLCSNCHSAVHVHMRAGLADYQDVKSVIMQALGLKP